MFVFYSLFFVIISVFSKIPGLYGSMDISVNEWLCADSKCSVPISKATTLLAYTIADSNLKLTFKPGKEVLVYRKPGFNEKEQHYWWTKLDEQEGYIKETFLRETKVFRSELKNVSGKDLVLPSSSSIKPSGTFEVISGTTIYTGSFDGNNSHDSYNEEIKNAPDEDASVDGESEDKEEVLEKKKEEKQISSGETGIHPELSLKFGEKSNKFIDNPVEDINKNDVEKSMITDTKASGLNTSPLTKSAPDFNKVSIDNIFGTSSYTKDQFTQINNVTTNSTILEQIDDRTVEDTNKVSKEEQEQFSNKDIDTPDQKEKMEIDETIKSETLHFVNTTTNQSSDSLSVQSYEQNNEINVNITTNEKASSVDETSATFVNPSDDNKGDSKSENESINNNTLSSVQQQQIDQEKIDIDRDKESSLNDILERNDENTSEFGSSDKKSELEESVDHDSEGNINKKLESDLNDPSQEKSVPSPVAKRSIENVSTLDHHDFKSPKETNVTSLPNLEYSTIKPTEAAVTDKIEIPAMDVTSPEPVSEKIYDDIGIPVTPDPMIMKEISTPDFKTTNNLETNVGLVNSQFSQQEVDDNKISEPHSTSSTFQSESSSKDVSSDHSNNVYSNHSDDTESGFDEVNTASETSKVDQIDESNIVVDDNVNYETQKEEFPGEPSQSWFSSGYVFMDSLKTLYFNSFGSKSEMPNNEVHELPTLSDKHDDVAENSEMKKFISKHTHGPQDNSQYIDKSEPEMSFKDGYSFLSSFNSMMWLIGSSIVVLFFSLGYYYLENVKRDDELVKNNNILSSEIFVLQREKVILEEDYATLKEDMQILIEGKNAIADELSLLKQDYQKLKEEKLNVEERESKVNKKIVMVENNYRELRKILSESKQKTDRATLIEDINKLKESIAADTIEISSLKEELQEKKNEIKQLTSDLQKSKEAKLALQERTDKLVIEGEDVAKGYQESLSSMQQTIEENKLIQSNLEEDVRKLKKDCETMLIVKELAESELQKAHAVTSKEALADWLEVEYIRTSLISTEKDLVRTINERDSLLMKLKSAEEKGIQLNNDVAQLKEQYEKAEKEKIDALNKLQVLSNYFKEKEIELQEELGMKEAQWLQKQSNDSTIYQQMRDLREENVNLKGLVETFKKEILEQETTYKKIINNIEQKAHENWVSFHRSEIRLKEVQSEAAQLRNRLTTYETCEDNQEDKLNKTGLEVNGDLPSLGSAMSPPFMLYHNEFVPPPPLVPPPTGGNPSSRPPPLGRISSPPLVSGDFIPPPPLIAPYDVYSHIHPNPSSPPQPAPVLHKPQPRDHHIGQPSHVQMPPPRKQKDSQSSNHSSESPLDKTPARRSKR